jgi:hypothetical protein
VERLGLSIRPDSLDERILGRALLRAFAQESERAAAELREAGLGGFSDVRNRDECHSDACSKDNSPVVELRPSTPDVFVENLPVKHGSPDRLTIAELWGRFADDQVIGRCLEAFDCHSVFRHNEGLG